MQKIIKHAILLCIGFVSLVLVSCDDSRYEYDLSSCNDNDSIIQLQVKVYDSYTEIDKAYSEFVEKDDGSQRYGFARWNTEQTKCIVYVPKIRSPRDSRKMETWGHELMHCVCGKYHPE
jgi:hypothetical protein